MTLSNLNIESTFNTRPKEYSFIKEGYGKLSKVLADSVDKANKFYEIKPYFRMEVPHPMRYNIEPNHTIVYYTKYKATNLIDLIIKDQKKPLQSVLTILQRDMSDRRFKEEHHQLVNRDPFVAAIRRMSKEMNSNSSNDKLFRDLCAQIERSIRRFFYIPYRICHGNLCFDNMMLGNNNIIYICGPRSVPIESILWDIAKLRQDSKYLITFQYRYFKEGSKNHTRIVDFCNKLEEKMLPIWQAQKAFRECYDDIAKLAWLDTYHYTNNEKVKEKVLEVLQNG